MQLLKQAEVAQRLGVHVDTFRKVVKHYSKFPRPVKLTPKSRPRWRDVDIEKYISNI
jgi:predicted DNA-binding transcriptional regulator AlpA